MYMFLYLVYIYIYTSDTMLKVMSSNIDEISLKSQCFLKTTLPNPAYENSPLGVTYVCAELLQ
jgi:hypothetical protein